MAHHELKIETPFFDAVVSGEKTFEIRFNDDRGFQKGDTVLLKEYHPALYRNGEQLIRITYVTSFKQKEGWVVFGFKLEGE